MIKYKWFGSDKLAQKLKEKSMTDFRQVERKNLLEMRDRAVEKSSPSEGGTPRDTGELRQSASVSGDTMGYTKDYAPHVEYGHRTKNGGFVKGQYYLRTNLNIQKPLFKKALKERLKR